MCQKEVWWSSEMSHTVPNPHPQFGGKCFRARDWQKSTNNTSVAWLPHGSQQLPRYSFCTSLPPSLSNTLSFCPCCWKSVTICLSLSILCLCFCSSLWKSVKLCLCACLTVSVCFDLCLCTCCWTLLSWLLSFALLLSLRFVPHRFYQIQYPISNVPPRLPTNACHRGQLGAQTTNQPNS